MATSTLAKLQLAVQQTERHGEEFLDVRAEVMQLNRIREDNRQALTALRKMHLTGPPVAVKRPSGAVLYLPVAIAIQHLQEDQEWCDTRLRDLREEEKRLMAVLAETGAGPSRVGPGTLNAMLTLRDSAGAGKGPGR